MSSSHSAGGARGLDNGWANSQNIQQKTGDVIHLSDLGKEEKEVQLPILLNLCHQHSTQPIHINVSHLFLLFKNIFFIVLIL